MDPGHVHIGVAAAPLQVHVSIGLADSMGASPEGCVELLGIRPLLFGTAWKVLDLFMDSLMAANHCPPIAWVGTASRPKSHALAVAN